MVKSNGSTKQIQELVNYFEPTVDTIANFGICVLNLDTEIVSWNAGAEKISGRQRQDVVGTSIRTMFSESSAKNNSLEKLTKGATKKSSYQTEAVWLSKNNATFLADITLSLICSQNDTAGHIGYLMIFRDITKPRQQATEQIDANTLLLKEIERRKKVEEALHLSNEELDAFASAASHDLQEPLRMVVSYLQLLERRYEDKFDKDGKEFLEFAVDGASRMKTLISDLVEYSRVDMLGKPFMKTKSEEALNRAVENLKVAVKENKAKITHDALPEIWSDPIQLTQLFQNLLANALKFRRTVAPRIHVSAEKKDNEVVFRIRDNGQGIEEKNLKHVFVIFKQLNKRSNRSGSGLGLAITKKIISRHNGRIWAESDVGKGSTFFFTIPDKPTKEVLHD